MARGRLTRSGAHNRAQVEATTGHHIHRCSALKQPSPHSGQGGSPEGASHPGKDGGSGSGGWLDSNREADSAPCAPRCDAGSRAHPPSASHGPAQDAHQARPGRSSPGGAQVRAGGAAHTEQVQGRRGGRARWPGGRRAAPRAPARGRPPRGRHRVLPGNAFERNRNKWWAAVYDGAAAKRYHSHPSVGAHGRRSEIARKRVRVEASKRRAHSRT